MESQASFTAELRRFIMQTFNDEELNVFCFDYFRDVNEQFTTGMSKGQRVQMLIEHCERRSLTQRLLLALDKEREGQLPSALKAGPSAPQTAPSVQTNTPDQSLARDYQQRGDKLLTIKDYATAILAYDLAIQHDPTVAECFWARAECRHGLGEYDAAIADYTRAILLNPSEGKYFKDRGASYDRKRDYDRALADLTRAIEIEPNSAKNYYQRSIVYYYMRSHDLEQQDVQKAASLGHAQAKEELAKRNW